MQDYECIVEYCYNSKQETFVIRFLNGDFYSLKISDLPKKMLTKKPDWENTKLSPEKNALIYEAGGDLRQILAHTIHAKGKLL